jgi:DNA-directed RNA polymerase subunit N (RpoN/RPB10)
MAVPHLCYECGEYLGSLFEFINIAKQGFYKEITQKSNVDIDKIDLNGSVAEPIGFILDAVKLNKICCRKCIIGYVDFNQYLRA